jgi:hypothetical protein
MVCEFLAELCELLLPILLLTLVLVHLAEDGIFLVGLDCRLILSAHPRGTALILDAL